MILPTQGAHAIGDSPYRPPVDLYDVPLVATLANILTQLAYFIGSILVAWIEMHH